MTFRYDLPDIDNAYALADWLEVMILRSRKPQIARAQLVDAFVAKLGSSSQELDVPVAMLFKEIARRRRIAGTGYPLWIDGSVIKFDHQSDCSFYVFLLLLSLDGPMRRERRFKEIDEIFDKVVCEAVEEYFGPGTSTLRFGWPPSDGRPNTFPVALDWLSTRIGVPVGSGMPAPATKDGGLDVVAWKPFEDHRSGFAMVLVQCTVQSDWFPKAADLLDDVWRGRLDMGRSPLTSLAVPFVIPKNFAKWDDLRRMVHLIFDRLRLAQMLAKRDPTSFAKMVSWNKKEISKFSI